MTREAKMTKPRVFSGWTFDTYAAHNEAMRVAEEKFQQERDRRYAEVKSAEEKALRVKEQADRDALGLAREIQAYKDEKANELREQIGSERGLYATKADLSATADKLGAQIQPLVTFMASVQGQSSGANNSRNDMVRLVTLLVGLIAIGTFLFVTLGPKDTPPVVVQPTVRVP